MNGAATGGTCAECGHALVQITHDGKVVRTYHPHNALPKGFNCPALIPIQNSDTLSLNVADHLFIMNRVQI